MNNDIKNELYRVVSEEAAALTKISKYVHNFVDIVELVSLRSAENRNIFFSGMGKCSFIAGKLASTFSSLGIPSFELDCANALHGDVGKVRVEDLVFILSKSGETDEAVCLAKHLNNNNVSTIAVTCNKESTLYSLCNHKIFIAIKSEACYLRLAPTTSSTCMLAVGDAIGVTTSKVLGIIRSDFARSHSRGVLCK